MQEFFALADERQWIYTLPKHACVAHTFARNGWNKGLAAAMPAPAATATMGTKKAAAPASSSSPLPLAVTVKRPANTAPVGNVTASSPDVSAVVDLSFSSSPDMRPKKVRKLEMSSKGKASTPSAMKTAVKKVKDRPILRDILNAQ